MILPENVYTSETAQVTLRENALVDVANLNSLNATTMPLKAKLQF